MKSKGLEQGPLYFPAQPSTTEQKFLHKKLSANFQIRTSTGVCGHHIPLAKLHGKYPRLNRVKKT